MFVFVSDSPFAADATVAELQADGSVWSVSLAAPVSGESIPVDATGRYVRVARNGTYLNLAEVEIFGVESSGPVASNVALGKSAVLSSTYPGAVASRAVDGNTSGVWRDASIAHSARGDSTPWLDVDLGGSFEIDSVTLWARTDCCPSRFTNMFLFVSDSPFGADETVESLLADGSVWSVSFAAPVSGESIPVDATGRYVRVARNGTYLNLAEVEIFGVESSGPVASNVALGKDAVLSSTYPGAVASRAVDGNTSGVWRDASIAHSAGGDATPWLDVDLGGSFEIDSVTLWARTDCCPARFTNMFLFVSDSPFAADATTAELQADGSVVSVSLPSPTSGSSVDLEATGRYVRVARNGTYLNLAEVEIFGVESSGPMPSNVALGKDAVLSSTYPGAVASRAVDGNTSGVWRDASIAHSAGGDATPWLDVDLGGSFEISSASLWARTDCCPARFSNMFLFVSDSPFAVDATVAELQADGSVWSVSLASPVSGESIPVDATGRYVRVARNGTYLNLAEVEIFGVEPSGPAPVEPDALLVSAGNVGESVQLAWELLTDDVAVDTIRVLADGAEVAQISGTERVWNAPASLEGSQTWAIAAVAADGSSSGLTSLDVVDTAQLVASGSTTNCRAIALTDGQTLVRVDGAADGWSQLLYEEPASGEFIPFQWLGDHPELGDVRYSLDAITSHAGSLSGSYRIVTHRSDGVAQTYPCASMAFDSALYAELHADGFPVLDTGELGIDVALLGQRGFPTPVPSSTPIPEPELAGEIADICSAGGLRTPIPMTAPNGEIFTRVTIPTGMTFVVDWVTGKNAKGNWSGSAKLREVAQDGSVGAVVSSRTAPIPNYHATGEQRTNNWNVYTNTGPTREFYFSFSTLTVVSIYPADGAYQQALNPRFVTATGHEVGDPCGPAEYFDCLQAGGNMFVETQQTYDGTTLGRGCYYHESCASSSLPGFLESAAVWSCKNEDRVQLYGGFIVLGSLLVVTGGSTATLWGRVGVGGAIGLGTSLWSCNENPQTIFAESFSDLDGDCVAVETALGGVFGAVAVPGFGAGKVGFTRLVGVTCAWGAAEGTTGAVVHGYVQPDEVVNAPSVLIGGAAGCVTAGVISGATRVIPRLRGVSPFGGREPTEFDRILTEYPTSDARKEYLEELGNTVRKGNFGEMATDRYFENLGLPGFRVVHRHQVVSIDAPIVHGIDHIFVYTDVASRTRFVVVETKYSELGTVNNTSSKVTATGRQMSDRWIDARARTALSAEDYEVFLESGYDRVLASVDLDGNVVRLRTVDADGKAGEDWVPNV